MSAVSVKVESQVATITLDSPKTRNALNSETSRQLVEICDDVDQNPDVGAVVVRGANSTFCSGAERGVLDRAGEDPAGAEHFGGIGSVYAAFVRIGTLAVPTVAAVRGAAVGAGVNLLLATDLRVVATNARIIAGFATIGLHPGGGHFTLLDRLGGRELAAAVGVFGAELSGQRAYELGIAWAAVDDESVEDRAFELARTAAKDPELARRTVLTMRQELGPPGVSWAAGLEMERGAQMWSLRRRWQKRADSGS
ncbi:MAG: enoyl-CoA hydratase-related protein [Actinomycetota bacterium]|nr:enoyl-CoA hydratase-related protein [Actinomycetota bacterium]